MTDSLLLFRRERPAPDVPDEHLLSLCAAGNAAALDLLFRRHGDRVYRFLGRLPVVARRNLEDLARATFIEAYREAGEYAERTSVSVWIVGIAVGVVRQYLAGPEVPAAPPSPSADHSPRNQGPVDRLARALADLPGELQLAFVLERDAEIIERRNPALQLDAVEKEHHDRRFFPDQSRQKFVLKPVRIFGCHCGSRA